MKGKNHVIVAIDAKRSIWQDSTFFHGKTLNKLGIKGIYISIIEAIYGKPTASTVLNSTKLKTFPPRLETRQKFPLSPFLFSTVLEILARSVKKEKEKKRHPNPEEGVKLSVCRLYDLYSKKL